jgi:hypothetical protein
VPPTFTALGSRSTPAILALYVKVGACLLAIGADVGRIVVAERLGDGRVLVDALLGADRLVLLASLLELAAFLVAAVLFLRWQVVAHRNLPALGEPEPRVSVGAGVAAWFVPLVSFVRPFRVVGDLWRAGERDAGTPALLRVWWVAWLAALAAVVAAWTLLGEAADVGERQRIDALRAGATALSAAAAGLALAVVSQSSSRQEARARALAAPRTPSPTAKGDETTSAGGLRVVSEQQARRSPPGP